MEAVLLLELGLDVRSVSEVTPGRGGWGEREGRDACDISEADRDPDGKEDRDVRVVVVA